MGWTPLSGVLFAARIFPQHKGARMVMSGNECECVYEIFVRYSFIRDVSPINFAASLPDQNFWPFVVVM